MGRADVSEVPGMNGQRLNGCADQEWAMKIVWVLVMVPLVGGLCLGQEVAKTGRPEVPAEETAVYAAVIAQLAANGDAKRPLISNTTSTFVCGTSCNGMLVGKCSGMRQESKRPEQAVDALKARWPSLKKVTEADFETKNASCSRIAGPLPMERPHHLFSRTAAPPLPAGWEHPDYLYFSRVGFDGKKSQALVYVAVASGTDATRSGGTYVLADRDGEKWKVERKT
jgi:hypothetical protein